MSTSAQEIRERVRAGLAAEAQGTPPPPLESRPLVDEPQISPSRAEIRRRLREGMAQEAAEANRQQGIAQGVASQYNADQYAEAVKLSKEFGIDAKSIADNIEPYRAESRRRANAATLNDAPVTRDWLTNLDNAAVAMDDTGFLAALERQFTTGIDMYRSTTGGAVKGAGSSLSGIGRLTGASARAKAAATDLVLRLFGADSLADSYAEADKRGREFFDPEQALIKSGTAIENFADRIGPPVARQNFATDVAGGIGQIATQVLIGLASEGASFAALAGQGADIQGDRATEAGASQLQTDIAVVLGAAITGITERYQLERLLKAVPSPMRAKLLGQLTSRLKLSETAQRVVGRGLSAAEAGLGEAVQEITEGIGQNIAAKQIYDPNAVIFDTDALTREGTVAGAAGTLAKFVIDAIVPGHARTRNPAADREATAELQRIFSLGQRMEQTEQGLASGEMSARLVQLVNDSKLAPRSPEALESFVKALREKTGIENAYIDAAAFRTLYQSDQEANAAASALTGETNAYAQATVTGAPIAVPVEKYLAQLAPKLATAKVEGRPISDYVSFTADGLNAAEANEQRDALLEEARKAAVRDTDAAVEDSSQAVYDDVLAQLKAARMEPRAAEFSALQKRAFFRTMGKRSGRDPLQLYRSTGLRIRGLIDGTQLPGTTELTQGGGLTEGGAGQPSQPGEGTAGYTGASTTEGSDNASDTRASGDSGAALSDAGQSEVPGRGELRGGSGGSETALGASAAGDAAQPTALAGLPASIFVDGRGQVSFGPFAPAHAAAAAYAAKAGIAYSPNPRYAKVDVARAKRIADAYAAMPDAPNDPAVAASYAAMIKETLAQYQAIKETGLVIEAIEPDQADPYELSPRYAILDVIENNHLWFYPSTTGFGTDASFDASKNPLLAPTDEFIGERRLLANDVFRIVHDYFGHIKDGVGFRADGEENAWRSHVGMYSPLARGAMTSETRGQNSWLNYGPYGETNRTAKAKDTKYADQKAGLLPEEFWTIDDATAVTDSPEFKRWFGDSKVVDEADKPLRVYHGTGKDFGDTFRTDPNTGSFELDEIGAWFAAEPRLSNAVIEHYAERNQAPLIVPAYLSIKNPVVIQRRQLMNSVLLTRGSANTSEQAMREMREMMRDNPVQAAKEIKARLIADGYDGLKILDDHNLGTAWVAFNPSQIKSATGNRGTFAAGSDNILYQDGPIWKSALTDAAASVKVTPGKAPPADTDKAPAADWLAKLRKSADVKEEEIFWSGIEEWFKTRPRQENGKEIQATRREVMDYLRGKQMRIVDVGKGAAAGEVEPELDQDEIDSVRDDLDTFRESYREMMEDDDSNYYHTMPSVDDYTSRQEIERESATTDMLTGETRASDAVELSVEVGSIDDVGNGTQAAADVTVRFPDDRYLVAPVRFDLDDGYVRVSHQGDWSYEEEEFTPEELDAAENALEEMKAEPGEREMYSDAERHLEKVLRRIDDAISELEDGNVADAMVSLRYAYQAAPSPEDAELDRLMARLREAEEAPSTAAAPVHDMRSRRLSGASEDYWEILLTVPDVPGTFKEELHWEEENFVVHARGDVRVADDGVRTLYIDEKQSDWNQQGRKYGYIGDPPIVAKRVTELPPGWSLDTSSAHNIILRRHDEYVAGRPWPPLSNRQTEDEAGDTDADRAELKAIAVEMYNEHLQRLAEKEMKKRVPNAPFKDTPVWTALMMKRMIRYAVDNGLTRIAWSRGRVQNERWGLAEDVDYVDYSPNGDGTYKFRAYAKDGGKLLADEDALTLSDIPRYIGGELTERIKQGIGEEVELLSGESRTWRRLTGRGLKTGAYPMIYFYETTIPSVVKEIGKKYGVKVSTTTIPANWVENLVTWKTKDGAEHNRSFDWIEEAEEFGEKLATDPEVTNVYARAVQRSQMSVQSMDITPEMREAAKAGQNMFQRGAPTIEGDETGKRGSIQIGADRKFTINLFEKRDLSTYLHESGHLYLEVLGDLAEDPASPQQIKDDYAKLLKWFGVDERAKITTKHHEQLARGFEAYLAEGKAPSVELQGAFFRFRQWMLAVYKAIRAMGSTPGSIGAALNVSLTDEVRGVFDRMLATDEEIAEAEGSMEYAPIFATREEAGFSEEEWKVYRDTADKAHREDVEDLTGRAVAELAREKQRWWKEERKAVLAEVTAEANASPVYRAIALLTKGTNPDGSALPEGMPAFKLSRADITAQLGEGAYTKLPRGSTTTGADGISIETAAQLLGFSSGANMVRVLSAAPSKKVAIAQVTTARMRERHGDMMLDGSMVDKALDVVHSEGRAKVLAAELRALNAKRREVKPFADAAVRTRERENRQSREANAAALPDRDEMKVIREAAQLGIANRRIRTIEPQRYRNAERKAARTAFEMAGRGKFEEAYLAKRQQIINFELYRAAIEARATVDKQVDYMRRFEKKSVREKLAAAKGQYLEQIDALRERFDFTQQRLDEGAKRDALVKWVDEQRAAGREVAIPQWVIDEARTTPYKELTPAELQGVVDAAKNIEHLAKTKDQLLKNRAKANFEQAKVLLEARARESLKGGKAPPLSDFEEGLPKRFNRFVGNMFDTLLRPETLIERLDGGKSGPWHDFLFEPANRAEYARESMRAKVLEPMRVLASKIDRERRLELNEPIQIDSLGRTFDRRELISIALNMGNASNMERLLEGGFRNTKNGNRITKFTPQSLNEIKDKLNAKDWAFIQEAWNTAESLWPEMVAFQKRLGGLVPEKIPATPVQTRFGTFTGGYWPAVYDALASKAGAKQVDAADALGMLMGANFTNASTNQSALQERTGNGGPLKLDFSQVMGRHLDQVITDITHREFAVQALRILDDPDLSLTLQDTIGEVGWHTLRGMVARAIHQDAGFADLATKDVEIWQRRMISNLAVAALGFKVVTAMGNMILAPIQAAARVSPKYILKGFARHMSQKDARAFVDASSEMMRNRAQNMDASFNVIREKLIGRNNAYAEAQRAAMAVHQAADNLVTTGLWLGAYSQALDAGNTHAEAARIADTDIRMTQTAGAPKDLSAFEGNPAYRAFKLFIGPMIIMQNRMRDAVTRQGVVKTWPEAFGVLMATYFLPAILWDLVTGRGPDDDDKDDSTLDDFLPWALRKLVVYPFMSVPYLRDVASLAERKLSNDRAEPRMNPGSDALWMVEQLGETVYKQAISADDADDDDDASKIAKATTRAAAPFFGVPTAPFETPATFMYDVWTGEYEPQGVADARYLLIRRPKDE